jgi:uncharacterized protein (DUF302 family)/glutaredoxin
MNSEKNITLFQREGCPYCQLVRKKLTLLEQPFLSVPVPVNGTDRKELIERTGQNEVPALINGDDTIIGSRNILTYLDKKFGGSVSDHMPANSYGFSVTTNGSLEQVKERTKEALKKQGFGVLTEINVHKTLKEKIGADVPRQLILGACNPGFAHKAMSEEAAISLLLPCNVTIRETDQDQFEISIINPVRLLALVGREDLVELAQEASAKLKNALDEIAD